MIGFRAAQKQRGEFPRAAAIRQCDSRHRAQNFLDRGGLFFLDVLAGDYRDRRQRFIRRLGKTGRGNQDGERFIRRRLLRDRAAIDEKKQRNGNNAETIRK